MVWYLVKYRDFTFTYFLYKSNLLFVHPDEQTQQ
jgi:hypothetical protein